VSDAHVRDRGAGLEEDETDDDCDGGSRSANVALYVIDTVVLPAGGTDAHRPRVRPGRQALSPYRSFGPRRHRLGVVLAPTVGTSPQLQDPAGARDRDEQHAAGRGQEQGGPEREMSVEA
jgi:hypothetical protein